MMDCIDPRRPFSAEIRRVASLELDLALGALELARSDPPKGIHECRRAIKRLRALWRLVRSGDAVFCRAEDVRLRQIAHSLADIRQASALVETADRLAGSADGVQKKEATGMLRSVLEERQSGVFEANAHLETAIANAADGFSCMRESLDTLELPEARRAAAKILRHGVEKAVRRAIRAMKTARETDHAETFHDLRKAIKTIGTQARLLKSIWPNLGKREREAVERFGDRSGELQDFVVLDAMIETEGAALVSAETAAILRDLIASKTRKLKRRCLRDARALLVRKPEQVARKLATLYALDAEKVDRNLAA